MPIDNIQDFPPGSQFTLNSVLKGLPVGTPVALKEAVMVAGGNFMAMVDPGAAVAKPFAVHPKMLDFAGESPTAADEADVDGAVLDYFVEHANMEHQLSLNFVGAYITATGDKDDLATLNMLMETAEIPVGAKWTMAQTATLYRDFQEMFSLEADPLIADVFAAEENKAKAAAAKASAPKPATAATTATVAKSPPAPTPAPKADTAATAGALPKVGGAQLIEKWDARQLGGMRIAAALLPIFGEAPEHFDADLLAALDMLKRCARKL